MMVTNLGFLAKIDIWECDNMKDGLKSCAANGINMARIWLGHEYFCVDTQNAGDFNIVNFS